MLGRVADSAYWMSRYVERAENIARFVDVNENLQLDTPSDPGTEWAPVVVSMGDEQAFRERHGEANRENVLHFLVFDRENPNSIASCVRAARENARTIREVISTEMWEQLNAFYLSVGEAADARTVWAAPSEFLTEVRMAAHLFTGITDTTMHHDEAWHFCRMGRLLERADKTLRLLDVKYFTLLPSVGHVGTVVDDIQWAAVLRSASALQAYRRSYHRILPGRVVDFLLLNQTFPRAVHYCLIKADESLHAVTGTPPGSFCNMAEQRMGQLRAELSFVRVEEVMRAGLHEFIDDLESRLNRLGDAIFETFFALQPAD